MEIKGKEISGVYEIVCKPIGDERGYFMRAYDDKIFSDAGISNKWVQENHSKTEKKGTIRGLQFKNKRAAALSVAKIKRSDRSHAHKTQAAIAMEQRAKVAKKTEAAGVYRKFIEEQKRKTKAKNA